MMFESRYADWTTQSRFVCGVKTVVIPGVGVNVFAPGATRFEAPVDGSRSSAAADVMFDGNESALVPANATMPIRETVPVAIAAVFRSRIASSSQSSVVSAVTS